MVNTINTLTERNKELLAKIEELENKEKTEISREAQLGIIDKIEKWKKENIEIGGRLKKYQGNTYPSHIMDNLREDWPLWKSLAGHVNFELLMVQYLDKKENPLDELLEMMLDSITRNIIRHYNSEGLKEKELKENRELREKLKEAKQKIETYYKELAEKGMENKEQSLKIEKLNQEVKHWKERAERGEEDAEIHFKALTEVSKEWNEKKLKWWVETFYKKLIDLNAVRNWTIEYNEKLHNEQTQALKEEVAEKSKEVKTANENLEKKDELIEELRAELKEKLGEIKKVNDKCEKTEQLLYLANKSLPSLPKKVNKFKQFGTKIKTKFKHLLEKNKSQKQEMIARIEVKVK